jgi:hypothetical protein
MPAELSTLSLPVVPAALPVVGHPGSTGRGLDKLMEARACADEANTISAATPATVILFIVRPRMDDVDIAMPAPPRCDGRHKITGFDRICARGRCGSSMPSACEITLAAVIVLLVMAGTSAIPATDYRAASNFRS